MNSSFYSLILVLSLFTFSCSFGEKQDIATEKQAPVRRKINKKRMFAKKNLNAVRPKIKVKVFVFDFFNKSPYGNESLGVEIAQSYRKRLAENDTMVVIEPNEIEALKGKKVSDMDFEDTLNILKAYDIRVFGYGSIDYLNLSSEQSKVGVFREEIVDLNVKLNIRFVELKSGKAMYERDLTAKDKSKRTVMWKSSAKSLYDEGFVLSVINDVTKDTVPAIERSILRLNWQGRVAKVIDSKVYINAGRKSGVEIGDLLKVVEAGEEILDPQTGQLLGIAEGRVKGTVQVEGYFGNDGSVAEIHTGAGFIAGDKVELY